MHSVIILPMYSGLLIICARINGSSIFSILVGSGISVGLFTVITSPLDVVAIKLTLGTVVITVWLNSLSKRSWIISICSIPKKPQRNPKPSACEVSSSKVSEASFSCNLSIQSRSSSNASVSTGKIPAKTIGFTSWKPLIDSVAPLTMVVMVSPTFTSLAFFIPVIM